MSQELLNYERIRQWAESKELGTIVGESCTNSSCPLAHYLHEQTGKHWSVGPSIRRADKGPKDRLEVPAWVRTMLKLVDEPEPATPVQRSVTRERFLEVLAQVKPEE